MVARLDPLWPTLCASVFTIASAIAPAGADHVVLGSSNGGVYFLRARWPGAGEATFGELGLRANSAFASFETHLRSQTPRALALRGTRMLVGGAYETNEAYVAAFDPGAVEAKRPDIGLVQHDEPRLASVDGLSLRADGRFWASGRTPGGQLALMRFGANDLPDGTYGDAGLVVVEGTADVRATKVAATPDGGALVAAVDASGGMTVRRFTATGALDAAYGAAGVLTSPFPAGGHVEPGRAQIALEPLTGAARFAGVLADPAPSGALRIRMTRILPNGSADPAFGAAGVAGADVALSDGTPWPPGEPYLLFDGSEDLGACQGKLAFALYRIAQRGSSLGLSGPGVAGTVAP